jgi:hypothetical protein
MKKLLAVLLLCGTVLGADIVQDKIDWPAFLGRHDPTWNMLPPKWDSGAFLGNGLMGAMIYAPETGPGLRWHIGRSDVTYRGNRIPIGDLVLKPAGKIQSSTMRLDLWNAEASGTLTTDRGTLAWKSFTHAENLVQVIEVQATGGEQNYAFVWNGGLAANPRSVHKKEKIPANEVNPPPMASRDGAFNVSVQALKDEGEHAVVWGNVGPSTVLLSVGYGKVKGAAAEEAGAAVKAALAAGAETLRASHRAWWHAYWPASFVSIPDTRLEGFYWMQMYKLASATRADRPAIDLMGPWFRGTPWPKIWWNLNIQLTYWPVLGANRLELGESLCRMLDRGATNLAKNAKEFSADSATIARTSSYDCAGAGGNELCNLPWTMHNYYLQYRYSMDEAMLRHRIFPLLKRSINYYLHLLQEGPDGRLHIPRGLSPEYPAQPNPNPDCNIDLALLRWGCQTLLQVCDQLKLADPQQAQWRRTLEKLTPYPTDKNGLMIAAKVPFAESHRHYSHLLMIYPLYIMNPEQPENQALINKSVDHWMGMPKALQGYSYTGASSICAAVGRRDEAVMYLNRLLDKRVTANTMYLESGPVIETPLSAAQSLHDILLTSWGANIRVFPGVPDAWKDVVIHNLRTEGAFLVSAKRKGGQTQWVRVKSLAGEPCRIKPALTGDVCATVPMKKLGEGAIELTLKKGEEALLYTGTRPPAATVQALAADPATSNFYGLKAVAANK